MVTSTGHKIKLIQMRLRWAIQWLLDSKIQNISAYLANKAPHIYGSFNSWYDLTNNKYPFAYTEITGYGIKTLLYLYRKKKEERYLERAKKAADWLTRYMQYNEENLEAKGAFRSKYELPSGPLSQLVYSFDTGVCVDALTDLFKITAEKRYLNSAICAAEWLIDIMQNESGLLKACYDLEKRIFGGRRWSKTPGPYHAKVSMGLLKLYKHTGNEGFKNSAEKLCKAVIKNQLTDGRFKTDKAGNTYVHAHCYAIEGLMFAYKETKNTAFKKSLEKGTIWLLNAQKTNGGISKLYNLKKGFVKEESTDVLAQTIRLWIINSVLNKRHNFFEGIEKAINRLLSLQCTDVKDARAKYGFYYEPPNQTFNRHVNSWATMFSIQALQMYLDWKKNQLLVDELLDQLI